MNKTLSDLKDMSEDFITADVVAQIIGAHPQAIRKAAREYPWRLGFPTTSYGNRTVIPRLPFIKFVESGEPWYAVMAQRIGKCAQEQGG